MSQCDRLQTECTAPMLDAVKQIFDHESLRDAETRSVRFFACKRLRLQSMTAGSLMNIFSRRERIDRHLCFLSVHEVLTVILGAASDIPSCRNLI